MATRQYIGARYVPKFYTNSVDGSTTWESNVVYDPLIYVTLTNGHMYISKKQVPATVGIPSSNAEYWLDVGNYSGISEELQEEIDALTAVVNSIRTYQNRKMIFISDSYGYMTTMLQQVVDILNPSLYNIQAQNGASFVGMDGGFKFISKLQAALQDPSIIGHGDEITDIVVVGGLNDSITAYSDTGQLLTAMTEFDTFARTNCPNAAIHLGYIGYADSVKDSEYQRTWHKQYHTIKRYIENAGALGWFYMANVEYVLHGVTEYISSDGIHPSTTGATKLAQAIVLALTSGYDCKWCANDLITNLTVSSTDPAGSISGNVSFSNFIKDNGIISFTLNPITYNYPASQASGVFSQLNVAISFSDYPFNELTAGSSFYAIGDATFGYNDGSAKYMECPVRIQFAPNAIGIKPYPFINGQGNWITAKPTLIQTKAMDIIIPTMRV